MKTDWPTKKLKDICSINGGDPAPQDYAVFSSDGIPFVRMQDLGRYHVTDNLTETRDKIKLKAIEKLGVKTFSKGSIILPRSGSVFANHRAILGIDAVVVSHIAILNNYKEIQPKYLFWYLTKLDIGRHAVKTSNVDSISFQRLGKFEIPVPPLTVQKQIVERLDKIAEAQKLNDGLIQKTDELFQSLLHKELNPVRDSKHSNGVNPAGKYWEVKKLKEICEELFAGGDAPRNNFSKTKTEKYYVPIFANGVDGKDLYGYTDIRKVTKPSITISARGTIGYPVIRTEAFYPIVRLIVLVPNSKIIDLYFLYYATRNFNFFNTGTSIPQLTIPMIERIRIPVPPIKQQKQIVAKLSAVQDYKKQLLLQKTKLKELFDSALAKLMKN